jgi:hypothetical protein
MHPRKQSRARAHTHTHGRRGEPEPVHLPLQGRPHRGEVLSACLVEGAGAGYYPAGGPAGPSSGGFARRLQSSLVPSHRAVRAASRAAAARMDSDGLSIRVIRAIESIGWTRMDSDGSTLVRVTGRARDARQTPCVCVRACRRVCVRTGSRRATAAAGLPQAPGRAALDTREGGGGHARVAS